MSDIKNQKLKQSFVECINKLEKACAKFPWQNKNAYGNWLAQTYYFVRHTTCFLGLASARFGHQQRDRQYHLLNHLREELDHDKIALNDLKNLGFSLEDFPELPETSAFYQAQYYFIEHEDPIAHFGYSLCLEGLAAKHGEKIYRAVNEMFHKGCCQFIYAHSIVDKDHFEHGLEFFNNITSREATLILRNLEQSCALYTHILQHITKISGQTQPIQLKRAA